MKWGIIILLFLGLAAALSASVLVGAIKLDFFSRGDKASKTVTVVVAAKNLPATTIITPECIEKKTLPLAELPVPVQNRSEKLVGEAASIDRVLGMGVVKGTILTESSFLPRGSAEELMAKIPPGMRALTVNLRSGTPDLALLRPGSRVDIVSITKLDRNRGGQSIASPLLNDILVLAVQGESVISNPTPEETEAAPRRRSSGGVDVTLQVDSQQAGALQLAISQGSIALVLRNPRDKMTPSMDPIMLDDGGRYIPIRPEDLLTNGEQNGGVLNPIVDPNATKNGMGSFVPVVTEPPKNYPSSQDRNRKVIIHRGTKAEEKTLEESKKEDDNANGKSSSLGSERRINEVKKTVSKIAR